MIDFGAAIADVAEVIDLPEALAMVSKHRNDMLPLRLEDKIPGNLRAGWIAHLDAQIRTGVYSVVPAYQIPVPKPGLFSRPASLMRLEERVLLEALVGKVRARVEKALPDKNVVFWPRGEITEKRWREFENEPLGKGSHIVVGDIAGFYESVEHEKLRAILLQASVPRAIVAAITALLGSLMRSSKGLPQGIATVDCLATSYLIPVDASLARAGLRAYRHGDDFRIPAFDYEESLRAAHEFEQSLRHHGLLANAKKLQSLTVDKYDSNLNEVDEVSAQLKRELEERVASEIIDDPRKLSENAEARDILEHFMHADIYDTHDREELIEMLRPIVKVEDVDQAWESLDDGFIRASRSNIVRDEGGSRDLEKEVGIDDGELHVRITRALPVLSASADNRALIHLPRLLIKHGAEITDVASYIRSRASHSSRSAADSISNVLSREPFMLGAQRAWVYNALQAFPDASIGATLLERAYGTVVSDRYDWLERIEALKLCAARTKIDRDTVQALWRNAPTVFRADIIAAVSAVENDGDDWPKKFLETINEDPVLIAIAQNLRSAAVSKPENL